MPTVFAIVEKDNGWEILNKTLRDLAHGRTYVKAGVLGAKGEQKKEGGATLSTIAAVHEFGCTIDYGGAHIVIPERSFIRTSWGARRDDYYADLKTIVIALLERRAPVSALPRLLALIGMKMTADMQATIRAGIPPELAPSTLAQRTKADPNSAASQSGAGAVPLIDTGQLLNSLSHIVSVGGQER
jgi:hypothetical protein